MSAVALAPLSLDGLRPPETMPRTAEAPKLRWIELDQLLVDLEYQRRLDRNSRRRIETIASQFDWRWFGALVVAPAGDGFAIIDGQHRACAAKLLGFPAAPCLIVAANRAEQASAFVAMNNRRVAVHSLQVHAAALLAGDPAAVAAQRVAGAAGVSILRQARHLKRRKPNETMAIGAIARALRSFGADLTQRALTALAAHPQAFAGIIDREWIFALCEAVRAGFNEGNLAALDVAAIHRRAREIATRDGVRPMAFILAALRGAGAPKAEAAPPKAAPEPPAARKLAKAALDASKARIMVWTPAAPSFGDPAPGRSALDQRGRP